jgi:hypothetical protein
MPLETMSQFASKEAMWEARAQRFARALTNVMRNMPDDDIQGETGLPDADCQHIAQARGDAALLLTQVNQKEGA